MAPDSLSTKANAEPDAELDVDPDPELDPDPALIWTARVRRSVSTSFFCSGLVSRRKGFVNTGVERIIVVDA